MTAAWVVPVAVAVPVVCIGLIVGLIAFLWWRKKHGGAKAANIDDDGSKATEMLSARDEGAVDGNYGKVTFSADYSMAPPIVATDDYQLARGNNNHYMKPGAPVGDSSNNYMKVPGAPVDGSKNKLPNGEYDSVAPGTLRVYDRAPSEVGAGYDAVDLPPGTNSSLSTLKKKGYADAKVPLPDKSESESD
jgi:hypothetical protein